MNTSEVLNLAADLIEQRGWAGADVAPDTAWGRTGSKSPLCLEGGIVAALGLRWIDEVVACPAYAAVADYLRHDDRWSPLDADPATRRLYRWNDRPDRTAAEVIGVLRAAAVVEAARESQPSVAVA